MNKFDTTIALRAIAIAVLSGGLAIHAEAYSAGTETSSPCGIAGADDLVEPDDTAATAANGTARPQDSTTATATATPTEAATFETTVKPFLKQYCVGCHGSKQRKGERRFDRLTAEIRDDNGLVDLQDILDQLNLSEMPPAKAPQPPDAMRQQVIRWLTARIDRHRQDHHPRPTQALLRRLNAREYRHTVRDLLHLNMTMFDPTAKFPLDQTIEHRDTDGATLVMSGHLLNQYLIAANQVIDKALLPLNKPPRRTWVFRDNFRQQPEIDQVHRTTNRFEHMTLYDVVGADKHEGAYGPILAFKQGVPWDGVYEIRLKAAAVNRQHPYDPTFLGTDPDEPLRLGIVAGDHLAGQLHKPQPVEPLLAELDLEDATRWYTVRVWLDAGYTPRFTFRNGLMDARTLWSRLLRKYPDQFPKRNKGGIVEDRFNAIKYGKLPQIHIHEIEIEGPIVDAWPTAGQRAILGDQCQQILAAGTLTNDQARSRLVAFLSRAYRRPATEEDVGQIMQVVATRQQAGRSSLEAFADGLKAALCSPHFLYLENRPFANGLASQKTPADPTAPVETTATAGTAIADVPARSRLASTALASRLSYFLWSSMPDPTLARLATDDRLQDSDVLASQVDRMLKDHRSDALIDGFLGSWLTLRELGATPPDRNQFREFYHYDLDSAMRRETYLFTRHLIDENLSIANFLDADFTFVNKPLAKLYGIDSPAGSRFELVRLTDRRRGGLLGQASVLTVTANGIDTSPVVRGVWILGHLLGTPPSPPPPDVEPLDPDIRGAKTIRDQLRKHRDVASCNDCHRKIDPLGFALENYDPIGKWRDTYNRQTPIDASGELPNGQTFTDIRGLKRILVKHPKHFARALVNQLLAYATGRQLTPADRTQVDRLLVDLAACEFRMRDLIQLVVGSELFRSNG